MSIYLRLNRQRKSTQIILAIILQLQKRVRECVRSCVSGILSLIPDIFNSKTSVNI